MDGNERKYPRQTDLEAEAQPTDALVTLSPSPSVIQFSDSSVTENFVDEFLHFGQVLSKKDTLGDQSPRSHSPGTQSPRLDSQGGVSSRVREKDVQSSEVPPGSLSKKILTQNSDQRTPPNFSPVLGPWLSVIKWHDPEQKLFSKKKPVIDLPLSEIQGRRSPEAFAREEDQRIDAAVQGMGSSTSQQRASPASCGISFIQAHSSSVPGVDESGSRDRAVRVPQAYSGYSFTPSDVAKVMESIEIQSTYTRIRAGSGTQMASRPWAFESLIRTERQRDDEDFEKTPDVARDAERHSVHTAPRALSPEDNNDHGEIPDFRQQPGSSRQCGSPASGVPVVQDHAKAQDSLFPSSNELILKENLGVDGSVSSGNRVTASDVAKAMESAEIRNIMNSTPETPTPQFEVKFSLPSMLIEAFVKQYQEAGPVQLWVAGIGPDEKSHLRPYNPDSELDEALSYLDPNNPPDFVIDMLRARHYPVPGDPEWQRFYDDYRASHQIVPPLQPDNFEDRDFDFLVPDSTFLADFMSMDLPTEEDNLPYKDLEERWDLDKDEEVGVNTQDNLGNEHNRPSQFYEDEILMWMKFLIAIRNRPRWLDEPEHGESLLGVFQELQHDSQLAFAPFNTAITARQPNTQMTQQLEFDVEQDAEVALMAVFPVDDLDIQTIRQWLKRLDDLRLRPPHFEDTESFHRFAEVIRTFYSVLIHTVERMYGDGVRQVIIDELVQFRSQLQGPSAPPPPELPESHRFVLAAFMDWMKGLYVMQAKAARIKHDDPDNPLEGSMFPTILRTFYLQLLVSGDLIFETSMNEESSEEYEAAQQTYKTLIMNETQELVVEQMTEDLDYLIDADQDKLNRWLGLFECLKRESEAHPKWGDDPALRGERSRMFKAVIDQITETAVNLLGGQKAEETLLLDPIELSRLQATALRQRAAQERRHLEAREELERESKEKEQHEARRNTDKDHGQEDTSRGEKRGRSQGDGKDVPENEAPPPKVPRRSRSLSRRISRGMVSLRPQAPVFIPRRNRSQRPNRDRQTALKVGTQSLTPGSELLNPPYLAHLQIDTPEQRKHVAITMVAGVAEGGGLSLRGLAIPKNFTAAQFDKFEEYIHLTYMDLKLLLMQISYAVLGMKEFEVMEDNLRRDLEFLVVAYYRFAAGQVDHCDPQCPRTSPPLECCYTKRFGTTLLEPNREIRHKLLMERYLVDVTRTFSIFCDKTGIYLRRVPDFCTKILIDWAAENGFRPSFQQRKELSMATGISELKLTRWFSNERYSNRGALDSFNKRNRRQIQPNDGAGNAQQENPEVIRELPVDTGHHNWINQRARTVLKNWIEEHHEYPFMITEEKERMMKFTGVDRKTIESFIRVYKNHNSHRLNLEIDTTIHRRLNRQGNGDGLDARYRLVGACFEHLDRVEVEPIEPIPPRRRQPVTPSAQTSVHDTSLDTEARGQRRSPPAFDEFANEQQPPDEDEQGLEKLLKEKNTRRRTAKESEDEILRRAREIQVKRRESVSTTETQQDSRPSPTRTSSNNQKSINTQEGEEYEHQSEVDDDDEEEEEEDSDENYDEQARTLLPTLEGPILQDKRNTYMLGQRRHFTRWIPSPETEANVFDLLRRAREQMERNSTPHWASMTIIRYQQEINLLISAHQAFANGERIHCNPTCNPDDDPGPCCFENKFGAIENIRGRERRMRASIQIFDAAIAYLNFSVVNENNAKHRVPLYSAIEMESWLSHRLLSTPKSWHPHDRQFEYWERNFGVPKRQARDFLCKWRDNCWIGPGIVRRDPNLPPVRRRRRTADQINYFREWFENNLDHPYLDKDSAGPHCQATNLTWTQVQKIIDCLRHENQHRIIETRRDGTYLRCRYRPHQPGDENTERIGSRWRSVAKE